MHCMVVVIHWRSIFAYLQSFKRDKRTSVTLPLNDFSLLIIQY